MRKQVNITLKKHRRSWVDIISAKIGRILPTPTEEGFTLAETLITIGIIGIVAAMTIPTLMTKLKNDRESAILKEDYSILQQMMKIANEEGAMANIVKGNNMDEMKEWFDTYFLPYIKTTSVCYNKWGCWSKNAKKANGDKYTNNIACGAASISFVLYNGSYVCMDDLGDFRFGVRPKGITIGILVDVNGDKQPNVIGEDIFALQFYENELLPGGYHMTKDAVDKNCSKKCTDNTPYCGVACTVKAQRQGFKLPVIPKK